VQYLDRRRGVSRQNHGFLIADVRGSMLWLMTSMSDPGAVRLVPLSLQQ
jgi:hypothetical protein